MAQLAGMTGGLAPATLGGAALDWWVHLLASPAKQGSVLHAMADGLLRLTAWQCGDGRTPPCPFQPLPQDKRFADPGWQRWPFNASAQAFLMVQQAWQQATSGVPGVDRHHQAMVAFGARQWLDMIAPSNGICSNPTVLQRTWAEGGANLWRGAWHAVEDAWREELALPPAGSEAFEVGRDVAASPGRVVMRNGLAELLQYAPSTSRTQREPVLLVPAWIMKYYVLDLAPHNSLVKALVDQGFTVFMLSWKNPTPADRDTGLADYHRLGIEAALDAIGQVLPGVPVHALGYCLGGTLLAMAAAALARTRPQALQSLTLLAAQTDFTDPGELGLFIDEGQVEMLDHLMWRQGVLEVRQLRGTFEMLRSQDLIWSHKIRHHLLGEQPVLTDLMAWNADGTRLPYRMHTEYLRGLFLDNTLARGEARLGGPPLNLADIRVPIFSVGAVQDHVAPWRSVFKLHALSDAEQTFVLTAGGHNVGIVNPPGRTPTSHRLRRWQAGERLLTPDEWLATTPAAEGSWWTPWFAWLHERSSGLQAPPPLGVPGQGALGPAPGRYVMQR